MTIQAFHAKGYGCLRDVHVTLGTRLHAFVGPNDSGKSTVLRGIRTVLQFAHGKFERSGSGPWMPFNPFPAAPTRGAVPDPAEVEAKVTCDVVGGSYAIEQSAEQPTLQRMSHGDPKVDKGSFRGWTEFAWAHDNFVVREDEALWDQLHGARLCQFDASALRSASGLIPESEFVSFFDERGLGLPGIYQALLGRDDEAFSQIRESARRLFPTLKRIAVVPITRSEVSLEISVVTRPSLETGTLITPLRATPHFERRSKVYALGELWLAYCDGDLESPLLEVSVIEGANLDGSCGHAPSLRRFRDRVRETLGPARPGEDRTA